MHMADALLSPAVGGGMYAVSVAAIAYSVKKIKKDDLGENKAPLMAVSGAMVFAAQMINFTIPGTGSSGHIGGGILLAALLGPFAGMLAMSSVLIIQCLVFADGGLLALGANIFNMGVIPCLIVFPLIAKNIFSASPNKKRIWAGSVISAVISLQLGAFSVVLQTTASGIAELPFIAFALLMQPIHLAIGIVEGIVTAAILTFVFAARPHILTSNISHPASHPNSGTERKAGSAKKIIVVFACIAVVLAAGISIFASEYPDGLEWSILNTAGTEALDAEGTVFSAFSNAQERTAFIPDYESADGEGTATPVAGIIGAVFVFVLAGIAALIIRGVKKKNSHVIK